MRKIVVLANDASWLFNLRKELIDSFIDNGYEVHLCLPFGDELSYFTEKGCIFHDIDLNRRGKNPMSDFKLYKQLKKILKNFSPDVVLTYTIKLNIYGALACEKLNIPVIMNITGLGTSFQNDNIFRSILIRMYTRASKKVSYILFQNKDNLNFFKKRDIAPLAKKKLINGSGVNLSRYEYSPYKQDHLEHKKFNFIGRIMVDKGILEFLEVAKKCKQNGFTNISFHVYGSEEDGTIEMVNDFAKEGLISYHGVTCDIKEVMKNSFALVLPTYHEGMSNVLLENAASGRINIASNIPGCQEIIIDKKSGFLFEKKNTEELYNAICIASKLDLNSANEFGELARNKVESEFDRKKICEIYNQLIDEIVKG